MTNPASNRDDLSNAMLGRYRLRYRVAHGGMGSVYLAQLASGDHFEKWVAIKTIHSHIASNDRFVKMFLNEARLAARIDHPNVCSVFDFGQVNGTYYLAMEYLHGESLNATLSRAWKAGAMPVTIVARVLADAARGLHAAHELKGADGSKVGVVHRDVSPQNIFVLYGGGTKVVDFGIARSKDRIDEGTSTGELKGKLAYMAPEQLTQSDLDRRADLWALGVVLWEACVGRRLFKRDNEPQTIMAVSNDSIPAPSSVRDGVPPGIDAIVARALQRDPAQRYQTAVEFARDLEQVIARSGTVCGPEEVAEFMAGLFADRIKERDGLLRAAVARPTLEIVDIESSRSRSVSLADHLDASTTALAVHDPPSTTDAQIDPPTTTITTVSTRITAGPATAPPPADAPPAPNRMRAAGVAILVLALGGAAGGAFVMRGRMTRGETAPTSSRVPPAPGPAPVEPAAPAPALAPAVPPAPPAVVQPPAAPAIATATPQPPATPSPSDPVPANANAAPRRAAHTGASARTNAGATRSATAPSGDMPPAAAAALSGGGTGYLTIMSSVRSEVFDGSHSLGSTPLADVSLSSGRHHLRIVPSDGSPARETDVSIERNATAFLNFR